MSHRKRIESLLIPSSVENQADSGEDEGETEIFELDGKAIRVAMPRLAPRQREVIEWRLFGGLTIQATAERMGCSEGLVRMTQTNAIRRLRKRLTTNGENGYGSKAESSESD
jgi:RNA polymerase sigma factor (sigma-70 family)